MDDVHRLAAGRVEPNPIGAPVVCASIAMCGPTSATVFRFTDPGLARVGTSTVLRLPVYEPGEHDIHEVLGEMVNIIGGNLKGIVCDGEQEWALSLPVVSNEMQHARGGRPVAESPVPPRRRHSRLPDHGARLNHPLPARNPPGRCHR